MIDSNGNIVGKYSYDAYGKVSVSLSLNDISYQNPFRYKGYYYDNESGLYYCGSRYYSPEFCRWISPDSIDYLEPGSINGLNLYAYCGNNPVVIVYSSSSVGKSATGGRVKSFTNKMIGNNIGNRNLINDVKPTVINSMLGVVGSVNLAKTNAVLMKHYTINLISNSFFGKISYTITTQLNNSKKLYQFIDIGNDGYSFGGGMNLGDWYGVDAYFSSNYGFGASVQVTPWFTYGAEISLQDGISFSIGTIYNNTTHEITANIGVPTLLCAVAVCVVIATLPTLGASFVSLAASAACVILIIGIFK